MTRDDGTDHALQASAGIDVAELLPDGRVIASDAERRLRVFSPSGAVLADIEMPVRIMSLRREGALIVALPSYMSAATAPPVVDVDRLRVVARLEGHTGQVFSARWISQGRVITAGADGTARLWDAPTGELLRSYQGSPGYLADAILTPEGMVIGGAGVQLGDRPDQEHQDRGVARGTDAPDAREDPRGVAALALDADLRSPADRR